QTRKRGVRALAAGLDLNDKVGNKLAAIGGCPRQHITALSLRRRDAKIGLHKGIAKRTQSMRYVLGLDQFALHMNPFAFWTALQVRSIDIHLANQMFLAC